MDLFFGDTTLIYNGFELSKFTKGTVLGNNDLAFCKQRFRTVDFFFHDFPWPSSNFHDSAGFS